MSVNGSEGPARRSDQRDMLFHTFRTRSRTGVCTWLPGKKTKQLGVEVRDGSLSAVWCVCLSIYTYI